MGMNNRVQLIGHLGADPEVRRLNSGSTVVNLRLATSDRWRDKQSGEQKEKTEWHQVVIFNENIAKLAEQYLSKGSKIGIVGKLQTRSWDDQDGNKRYATEVVLQNFDGELVFLDTKSDGDNRGGGGGGRRDDRDRRDDRRDDRDRNSGYGSDKGRDRRPSQDMDDEIPF